MSWDSFIWFAAAAVILWAVGSALAWTGKNRKPAIAAYCLGLLVFFTFILLMWISLERPPLRTMGETRLWYSFFLAVAGMIVYGRWKYKWILSFGTIMATVFIVVNLLKPEIHSKALMPALQSPWFAPHVIVYMFSYGVLGAATLMASRCNRRYLLALSRQSGPESKDPCFLRHHGASRRLLDLWPEQLFRELRPLEFQEGQQTGHPFMADHKGRLQQGSDET